MSPLEFMQRLAALVPRPRLHLVRFHVVLAPNAKLRSLVDQQTLQTLRQFGHQVEEREETFSTSYFGRPNAVMVQPGSGRLLGGVDQYKPTLVIGL